MAISRNRLRQSDWLLWRMASEHHCCFCAKLLFHGMDKKRMNITIHHLKGNIHTDNREKVAPITNQLFAHSACHKAYHQLERLLNRGKNADQERFDRMTFNIIKELNAIRLRQSAYAG